MEKITSQSENGAKLIADFTDRYLSHGGKLTMADVIDCACDDREITDEQEAFLLAHFEAHPVKAPDHWKARR